MIDLLSQIPNFIKSAQGERSFDDKLSPFIKMARNFIIANFADVDTLDSNDSLQAAAVAYAYNLAIPHLNLVLTPNGFATTQSSNLTAASSLRTDQLLRATLEQRDININNFLCEQHDEQWICSKHGIFFAQTLFQNLNFTVDSKHAAPSWQRFVELRPEIIDIELSLAEEWFSHELLAHLRNAALTGSASPIERKVTELIRSNILYILDKGNFIGSQLASIVNIIRRNPDQFPLWHNSAVAELFSPPIFKNRKNANGYFF